MPTDLPTVSVVIPVYNGEADLPDLLNCLKAQTYPPSQVEYLLVDNQSGDRTAAILQAAAEDQQLNMTIRPLAENQIQSSYAARNTGIRASRGEILAFTDVDCRPQPQWLATLVAPFATPEVAIAVGEILPLPGSTLWEQHAALENTLSQKHTLAHPFCPYGQTANLAIRRLALIQVGLFRPYLTSGGDADLCWRILRETDYQWYFVEAAVVQHRHRSTWRQLQNQWYRYGESNQYLHELHGVELMRELTTQEYAYRWLRWLLKELPIASLKAITRSITLAELLRTPIGLSNAAARSRGQRQAKLPEIARQIEGF
ncbi:MAG: glycosyltransferase [Actinomycetota bacterium]